MNPLDQETALLVVDMQKGFDDPAWGLRNNPRAEECVEQLLTAWRDASAPVVHVHHRSTSPTGCFRPETRGIRPKPQAIPQAGEPLYTKSVNSAFIGTSLEADLRRRDIRALVVVGLTTNHCVSTTVRMAGNLGFSTYVVADATAAFNRIGIYGNVRPAQEVHMAALDDLHGEFAEVVDTRTVVAALGRRGAPARGGPPRSAA